LEVFEQLSGLDHQGRCEILRRMELLPVSISGEALELLCEVGEGVTHIKCLVGGSAASTVELN
jgi:hypothetical protein